MPIELPGNFRIVCVDALAPKLRGIFDELLPAGSFASSDDGILETLAADAGAFLTRGRPVTGELIQKAKPLAGIQVLGRYPDRVDLEAARARGVPVATMPHGGAMAVADHTMALLLALARKIVPGHLGVVAAEHEGLGKTPALTSEWNFAFNWLGFPDVTEINRKTIGLIGLGEIGREVARRAQGFDMPVLYFQRRRLDPSWEEKLSVRYAELEDLLPRADIVSLHAPHTEETASLLDARRIGLMKPSAFLVNTSRGGLVDEGALAESLENGTIAGAALDVFVEEPLPRHHPFTRLPNVVLAPHTGGGSGGGQKLLIRQAIENVARMARGEQPENLVE